MWVTDIIRWDEWIPSTPKHILLYKAFGWDIPKYSHVPPLVWADRKKLSKRTWDVAVEKHLEKWYLVEALMNFLALLWWNPKTTEEFFTMDELIQRFELWNVQKAWAFFDIERLDFFNSHYLKTLDEELLFNKLLKYLSEYDKEFHDLIVTFPENYNKKIFSELKTRIKHFSEYKMYTSFFYNESKIPSNELMINEKMKIDNISIVKIALELSLKILNEKSCDFESVEEVKDIFVEKIKEADMKNGQILWPVRCAQSWEEFLLWTLELIYILWINK